MKEVIVIVIMLGGSLTILIAGLGILLMPDLYARISATSKASTLGLSLILFAVGIEFPSPALFLRAMAIIIFVALTTPVSAHMLGRVSFLTGVPLWEKSVINDYEDHFRKLEGKTTDSE